MNQYFEIGEEVVLVSEMDSSLNGEYVITDIDPPHDKDYMCPYTGTFMEPTRSYGYKLDELIFVSKITGDSICWFDQSALRKKHKPSDESFGEIMNSYVTEEVKQ